MVRKKNKDPFTQREAEKYDNPIASREWILSILDKQTKPISLKKLCNFLDIAEQDKIQALSYRLGAMIRDQQITQNRKGGYLNISHDNLIEGIVSIQRDGYGFLISSAESKDIFLNAKEMRKVFHGDCVKVAVTYESKQGKKEGEIRSIVKRNTLKLVGRIQVDRQQIRLISDNPKIHHSVILDNPLNLAISKEDIVVVDITQQPSLKAGPKGVIKEKLGDIHQPGIEIEMASHNFGIPHIFPDAVNNATAKLKDTPEEADKKQRFDLTHLPFVTIDGEDARDFDDAVYCEAKRAGGWRLYVAIADVAHYVQPGSALDQEAQLRGTSVYFPEQVIPMLPEKISNGLCSLKPKEDRLAMICEMTISAKGRLSGYQFYEAVIYSHARLTYHDVGLALTQKKPINNITSALLPHLKQLEALYGALNQQRELRGTIDFETTETRIVFNQQRKIEAIVPVTRNKAHKIIEECMLCANVSAARFLDKQSIPTLYRVHEGPPEKKKAIFMDYLAELGLALSAKSITPADYQSLLARVQARDDAHLIQTMMLRSMSQAQYQPDNKGHFGLAYSAYTHFTSPIRRYPDLLVHRAIKSIIKSALPIKQVKRIEGQSSIPQSQSYPYDTAYILQLGEHCSMTERRADEATRDVNNWLKCEFLSQHIGETFEGMIAAVTQFGCFVELHPLFIEGLVHVSYLDDDFYHFDAKKQRLIGEHQRKVFKMGDTLKVSVEKIVIEERRIFLKPVSEGHHNKPRKRAKTKKYSAAKNTEKPAKNSGSKAPKTKANPKPKKKLGTKQAKRKISRNSKPKRRR